MGIGFAGNAWKNASISDGDGRGLTRGVPRKVGVDHHFDQLLEFDFLLPTQYPPRFLRIADQVVDLGRP